MKQKILHIVLIKNDFMTIFIELWNIQDKRRLKHMFSRPLYD